MRVLLTGATGFMGPMLVRRLLDAGHSCSVLSRQPSATRAVLPAEAEVYGYDDTWPIADGVINMAGETVDGLWTARKRRRIIHSRVDVTRRLVHWMRQVSPRPEVLVSMSAVGIYGHRPGETLTEASAPDPAGRFRAQVTRAWEAEARAAEALGVRVALVRMANVLHPDGGYLGRLLSIYRFLPVVVGLGSGKRCFSWISRRDALRLLQFALEEAHAAGVFNASSPQPVTRYTFSTLLGQALGKPVAVRLPDVLLKLTLGEFSSAVLDSQYVLPSRAPKLGFGFEDQEMRGFLGRLEIGGRRTARARARIDAG